MLNLIISVLVSDPFAHLAKTSSAVNTSIFRCVLMPVRTVSNNALSAVVVQMLCCCRIAAKLFGIVAQQFFGYAKFADQFGEGKAGSIIKRDDSTRPPVIRLLAFSRPSTVFRRVVAVVVYAVERSTFWALTHIRNKFLKRIPSLANRDAPSPIRRKRLIGRVITSLPHMHPSVVNTCVRLPVSSGAISCYFDRETATTFRHSVSKVFPRNFSEYTARAFAHPHRLGTAFLGTVRRTPNDRPTSKGFQGQIRGVFHVPSVTIAWRF